ncbi:MAG: isoamylase early set domain-containing protein [Acidimicrobiales bacterium]
MIGTEPLQGTNQLRVTFAVPAGGVDGQVAVVGDFNAWDPTTDPLRRCHDWLRASVVLEPGRRYRFRYLAENGRWFNDAEVGAYEPNGMGDDNSLLDLTPAGGLAEDPDERLDLHNAAIDTRMASAHLCGTFDLRTGRTCIKPVRHHDSCQFVVAESALLATAAAT